MWRAWAQERRAGLPDVSAQIYAQLAALLQDRGLSRVLAYHALPGEPDLSALAPQLELYTTRAVFRPEPRLTLHPWHTATEQSRFGVRQPPRDAPQVAPERIQAVLLPGLAFDQRGYRLGYGGGFYDRLLPGWDVLTVGVIPSALLVPQLPSEPHDQPVQLIVTERGVSATGC